jgi:hypothetical protein
MSPASFQSSDAINDRQTTIFVSNRSNDEFPSHLVVDNSYAQLARSIAPCSSSSSHAFSPLEHDYQRTKQTQRLPALDTRRQHQHPPSPTSLRKRPEPPPVPPASPASQHGDFVVLQTAGYQSTSPTLDEITAARFDLTPNSPDWHYLRALDRLEGRRMGPRTPSSRSEIVPDSPTLKGLGIQGLSSAFTPRLSDQSSFRDGLDFSCKVKPDSSSETSSDLSLLREEQATFRQMARIAAKEAAAQTGALGGEDDHSISEARTESLDSHVGMTHNSPGVARRHLVVKRSPKHENLVPERDSTFLRNIKECARQEAALRAAAPPHLQPTHPALRDDVIKGQERDWTGQEGKQTPILDTLHLRRQVVENLQENTRQRLIDRRRKGKSSVDVSGLQQQKQEHENEADAECEFPSLTLDPRRASSASMLLPVIHHAFVLFPHHSSEGDLRA